MMTAEEYRRIMQRKNLLIVLFLILCIAGIAGAVIYYNQLKKTKDALNTTAIELEIKKDSLLRATESLQQLKDTLARQREDYANLIVSNDPVAINKAAQKIERSRDSARKYAREGYFKLQSRDFDGARMAFDKSEKFYNGYRDSYDVYFLLNQNKDKLNDPDVQKRVMQQVVNKYNSLRIISRNDVH